MNYRIIAGKTLFGFVVGTVLAGFMVGAAFVSFVAVATTADAYLLGGGSGVSPSIGVHNSATRSLTDSQRNNWNRPLDFNGGQRDPATVGTDSGGSTKGFSPTQRRTGNQRKPQ